jgi:hypothetical protein
MKGTLSLKPIEGEYDGDLGQEQDGLLEIDSTDLRLPLRVYQISYQVAEEGKFSLTTEFLLRLLKAVDSLSEEEVADFFGFSADEVSHVVSAAERLEFVSRSGGKVRLTEAGNSNFEASREEPSLYKVQRKTARVAFDLISFCPLRPDHLGAFERTLPEIPLADPETAANATPTIRDAFRRHFQEIQVLQGGRGVERSTIYSIDDVVGQNRSSALVPMSVKIGRDALGSVEPDLLGWKSGIDLENRIAVLGICGGLLKSHVVPVSFVAERGSDYLHECAPAYLERFFKGDRLDAMAFFRRASSQVGDLRKDRKTVRIFGTLWIERNLKKVLSAALEHSAELPGMNDAPLIWLRPDIPFWGCSTKLDALVDELAKHLVPEGRMEPRDCVILAHDDRDSVWRFGDVFDVVCSLRSGRIPRNFELLLVPGRIFAALVHVPLNGSEGYPMPLGIVSFDQDLVRGVHELMSDIVASGQPYAVKGNRIGDLTEHLIEALRLSANLPRKTAVASESNSTDVSGSDPGSKET